MLAHGPLARQITTARFWEEVRKIIWARLCLGRLAPLANRVRLQGRLIVKNHGELIIGRNVQLCGRIVPIEMKVERGARLVIGDFTLMNYGCSFGVTRCVEIGPHAIIGPYCNIVDSDYHSLDPVHRLKRPEAVPVILHDNVWLGARVMILPGVTIGANSAIGAGSVVTHSIPPDVLAAGVPARVIRKL